METLHYLHRLFAYNDWANRETLSSLKATVAPPPRSLTFMAHIIAAERLWMGRLKQDTTPVVVWPESTLEECEAQLPEMSQQWRTYLDSLTPSPLIEPIAYVNSKGEPWSSTVEDILMHVVMHSTYHRGQIASDLRASDHTPAYTDFIHAVRQGFIK